MPDLNAIWIQGLATTLMHFIWQALLIGITLKVFLLALPSHRYRLRYRSAVVALLLLCIFPITTYLKTTNLIQPTITLETTDLSEQVAFIEQVTSQTLVSNELNSDIAVSLVDSKAIQLLDWVGLNPLQLVILWSIGALFAILKFGIDINKTYRLTRTQVKPVSIEIQSLVEQLIQTMKVTHQVQVLQSTLVAAPVVIGWLKPFILLPVAISIGLDRQQLALILAHELAHIKRADFLVNLLQGMVQVIFFFHPVTYWVNKVIREEREFICDAIALDALGNGESNKLDLAKALLATAELKQGNFSLVAVAASGGHLKKRIFRIIADESQSISVSKLVVTFSSALFFCCIAIFSSLSIKEYRQEVAEFIVENEDSVTSLQNPTDLSVVESVERLSGWLKLAEFPEWLNTRALSEINPMPNPIDTAQPIKESGRQDKIAATGNEDNHIESAPIQRADTVETKKIETDSSTHRNLELVVSSSIQIVQEMSESELSLEQPIADTVYLEVENKLASDSESFESITDVAALLDALDSESTKNNLPLDRLMTTRVNPIEQNFEEDVELLLLAKTQLETSQPEIERFLMPKNENDHPSVKGEPNLLVEDLLVHHQGVFIEPKAIMTPYPRYPAEAFYQKLSGQVKVDFVINEDGRVEGISFEGETSRIFIKEIRNKLKRWRYEPAVLDGEKVAHKSTMYFEFDVPDSQPFYIRETGSRIKRLASR